MMEWLQLLLPAWIMGTLLVFLTAPLGCLMLWRRMSFFADTMAHGTLLGVAIAGAMSLPLWTGVTLIALLLVAILWVLHDLACPMTLCSRFVRNTPVLRLTVHTTFAKLKT
jgi:ABC-type Mn2+/Zn2+ transport systems, permease components